MCAETDLIALCLTADRCILRASGLGLAVHAAPPTLDHCMQTLSLYRPEKCLGALSPRTLPGLETWVIPQSFHGIFSLFLLVPVLFEVAWVSAT